MRTALMAIICAIGNGTAFNRVGTVELGSGGYVYALAFDAKGDLIVGGGIYKRGWHCEC